MLRESSKLFMSAATNRPAQTWPTAPASVQGHEHSQASLQRPLRSALLCALTAITLLVSCPCRSTASRGETVLSNVIVVHQNTDLLGPTDLYISDNGARLVARKGDISAVCAAPSWHILLHCKSRNLGYSVSKNKVQRKAMRIFTSPIHLRDGHCVKERDSILKLRLTEVTVDGSLDRNGASDPFIYQNRRRQQLKEVHFKVTDQFQLKPEVQNFVNWIYNQDYYPGLPLEMRKDFMDGSSSTTYRTTSIKTCAMPPSFFAYPTDYKTTANHLEVLVADDARTTLEELWGDIPAGAKK